MSFVPAGIVLILALLAGALLDSLDTIKRARPGQRSTSGADPPGPAIDEQLPGGRHISAAGPGASAP